MTGSPRESIRLPLAIALTLLTFLFYCTGPYVAAAEAPAVTLRKGDRGEAVCELQEYLGLAGYPQGAVDGIFGTGTYNSVVSFQLSNGLTADGVVGERTWDALISVAEAGRLRSYVVVQGDTMYAIAKKFGVTVEAIAVASGVAKPESIRPGQTLTIPATSQVASRGLATGTGSARGDVELIEWGEATRVFTTTAAIIDVATGLSFNVKRRGGSQHADAEPLTAADAATFKRIYGGAWSWARRAVIVAVAGRRMAASINGFPHGGKTVAGNDFPGHFCVHFLGSRTHGSLMLDPEHQRMVHVAAGR